MAEGILIGESIRVGASLDTVPLTVKNVFRADAGDESLGQPRTWTYVVFEVPDDAVTALAESLSEVLNATGGWYCDFRSVEETFVVFAGRTFRYRRGDPDGRSAAQAYALSVGVPNTQLDWPE